MSKGLANVITDCGDLALLLPLAAILAFVLWRFESRAASIAWLQALAVCFVTTFLLKMVFLTCGHTWGVNILSPSGHASMSTAVYGGLTIVIARQFTRWRLAIVVCGVMLIAAIALTRTALHVHNQAEVAIGLGVGLISLSVFAWRYLQLPGHKFNLPWLGASAVCAFAVLYGTRLPVEGFLYKFSHSIRDNTLVCHTVGATGLSRFSASISDH